MEQEPRRLEGNSVAPWSAPNGGVVVNKGFTSNFHTH